MHITWERLKLKLTFDLHLNHHELNNRKFCWNFSIRCFHDGWQEFYCDCCEVFFGVFLDFIYTMVKGFVCCEKFQVSCQTIYEQILNSETLWNIFCNMKMQIKCNVLQFSGLGTRHLSDPEVNHCYYKLWNRVKLYSKQKNCVETWITSPHLKTSNFIRLHPLLHEFRKIFHFYVYEGWKLKFSNFSRRFLFTIIFLKWWKKIGFSGCT